MQEPEAPDPSPYLPYLRQLARRFSGRREMDQEDLIFRDLNINGRDFVEEVERHFEVDLNEVSPRGEGMSGKDLLLSELCSLIEERRV